MRSRVPLAARPVHSSRPRARLSTARSRSTMIGSPRPLRLPVLGTPRAISACPAAEVRKASRSRRRAESARAPRHCCRSSCPVPPEAQGLAAGIDLQGDVGESGRQAAPLELAREREGQVGARRLDRRPDDDPGAALRPPPRPGAGRRVPVPAGARPMRASASKRGCVSPPPAIFTLTPVGAELAGRDPERHAPAACRRPARARRGAGAETCSASA